MFRIRPFEGCRPRGNGSAVKPSERQRGYTVVMARAPIQQVVHSRPVGAGRALSRRLAAAGFDPIHLPAITLCAPTQRETVVTRLALLPGYGAVIAVSAAAVRHARMLVPTLRLPETVRGFAVGAGSARALQRICAAEVMRPQRADSEGLLALAALNDVAGWRMAILAAPDGRTLLAETLRRRGAQVDVIHVYRRQRPRWDRRHHERLARLARPLVLVTSAESLRNLLELAGPARSALTRGMAVVSSERLRQAAADAGFPHIQRADGPDIDALLVACKLASRT